MISSAWWGKAFINALNDVTKHKRKYHDVNSPNPDRYTTTSE
jgi:hypothetical protein